MFPDSSQLFILNTITNLDKVNIDLISTCEYKIDGRRCNWTLLTHLHFL